VDGLASGACGDWQEIIHYTTLLTTTFQDGDSASKTRLENGILLDLNLLIDEKALRTYSKSILKK